MKKNSERYSLVTGASSGLGKCFAEELAKCGNNVLLVSLKDQGLKETSIQLAEKYQVHTAFYECDLSQPVQLNEMIEWVKSHYQIDTLINNAGIGAACEFSKCSPIFISKMIDINIKALSIITHQMLPLLKSQKQAYILNVSSLISFIPSGYKSIYPASKCFVRFFSLGLAEELKNTSVRVSVLTPGPMLTNKFLVNRLSHHTEFVKASVVCPSIVAKIAIRKMFRGKRLIVIGWINRMFLALMRLTPPFIGIRIVSNGSRKEVMNNKMQTEVEYYFK